MPRGGRRQGSPGTAYSNRTDLATNYDQQTAGNTAADGANAQAATAAPQAPLSPPVRPDDIPNLGDPYNGTLPVTAGAAMGPGPGPAGLTPFSPDPVRQTIQAILYTTGNPDMLRILNRMDREGR